jgi:hypothetical protein
LPHRRGDRIKNWGVGAMSFVLDPEEWRKRLAALPLMSVADGDTVFAEGTKTGRLLILKSGSVSIMKGEIEFAQVSEPGAVFGELSALLDAPHPAQGDGGVGRTRGLDRFNAGQDRRLVGGGGHRFYSRRRGDCRKSVCVRARAVISVRRMKFSAPPPRGRSTGRPH